MVYSLDGCEFYQTRELAASAADKFIDDYFADDDDYGYEAAQHVRVCKVVARAEVDPESCDIEMADIAESFLVQH